MKTKFLKSGFCEKLKLLLIPIGLLIGSFATHAWANDWYVVGCAISPADDFNQIWLNVARCGNCNSGGQGEWTNPQMSKAGITFEGKDLYVTHYEDYHGGLATLAFQLKKNGTYVTEIKNVDNSWKSTSDNFWHKRIIDYNVGNTGNWYAWKTMSNGAKVYFDATNWSQSTIKLVTAHANCEKYYTLTNITGTKLYYGINTDSWSDAMGWGVVGGTDRSGNNNEWITDISAHASEYTGLKNWDLNGTGDKNAYLCVNNGSTGQQPNMYYFSDYTGQDNTSTLQFNNTQTYNSVVKTIGGSYTSGNSKSTINISSYELTSQGGTTNRTPQMSTSESSETVEACRTANTRLQVGTPATGYQFDGWWTAATSGSKISDNTDYTYNPTTANTYYARFSEIARTVTVAYKCGSTTIQSSGSVTSVGVTTAKNATAPDITGYTFSTWSSMPSGVTTSSSLTGKTISINASAASQTITANYTLNSHTLTWNLAGGTVVTAGTCASVGATGSPSGSVSYGASITAPIPEKTGYTFTGWNATPAGTMPDNNLTYTAQWTEITHTVSFENDGNGTTEPDEDTSAGEVTGINIEASNNEGYHFDGWTITEGSGTFYDASDATTTFYPAEDATLKANFEANTYTEGVLDKKAGSSDGEYSVTYNATSIDIVSEPSYTGYQVDGYYIDADYNYRVADAEGNLTQTVTSYVTEHHWIYDGIVKLYTKWEPRSYTITLDQQGGTSGPTSFTVTMNQNNYDPTNVLPTRAGYDFLGYYTETSGGGTQIFGSGGAIITNVSGYTSSTGNWTNTTEDLELYANWTEQDLTFVGTTDGTWNTASNWDPACVPTSGHDVTISAEVTVSGTAAAKSVTIEDGGKVTIAETGVLEVQGGVTNTDADKLIINTTTSSQGALICDLTSAPTATVNMSIPSGGFHLIASPTGGAKVSSTFAGSGIYTYAWEEGKGWDRRGYYDDFTGNEAILIYGQTSCSFSGILSNACGGYARYSTGEGVETSAQGVNMIANPLTAPIKIAAMSLTGTEGSVHIYNGNWVGIAKESAGEAVIPALQGYGVIATSGGGTVSFDYATAVRKASNKNEPLKAPKHTDSDIYDHITVSVLTNNRKVDLKLYENEQFTERLDIGWEAAYIEGDGRFGELYAVADKKMNILATPDLEGTVLGFVPGQAASYTISFEGDGKGYYLNDLDMQESTLIEEGNTYVFTPNESTNATRFVISKMPIHKTTTGTDVIYDGTKARKQMIDGILYIIRDGRIYDATGVLVK